MNGRNVYNATNLHASIPGNSVTSWLHCTYGNESFETVEVGTSRIAGQGLFAGQDIRQGTKIINPNYSPTQKTD